MTSLIVPPFNNSGAAGTNRPDTNIRAGIDFVIDTTWDGQPVDHDPFKVHLEWFFQRQKGRAHKRVVKVTMEGPFFDDPPPPDDFGGFCSDLYNYECFEIFFSNDKDQYLEVEVGPHGHWLVLLLNGRRLPFNNGKELEINVKNVLANGGETWRCEFEIPLAYFPPNVTKFNAYAIHGQQDTDDVTSSRRYEALFPVTDGTFDTPDFHQLQFFGRLDRSRLFPDSFNDRPFNDLFYGDLWGAVC